jgi:NADH-quinone oxidoreductase subunit E
VSVRRLHPDQPTAPFAFTPENLSWAKKAIAKYPEGKQASAVIPVLWRAQEQHKGWVTRPILEYVGDLLGMAYIRVLEVATFYTMFQLDPVGSKAHVQVCGTTPCMLRGAEALKDVCRTKIHPETHHLNADGTLSWEEVECLGACVNAPMVQVWKDTFEDLTPETLGNLIDDWQAGRDTQPGPQNGRQFSMPAGGATALLDPDLYDGQRKFKRVEPPPPSPPAPITAAPSPPPAPLAPAPTAAAANVAPAKPAIVNGLADIQVEKPKTVAKPEAKAEIVADQSKAHKRVRVAKSRTVPATTVAKKTSKPPADGKPETFDKPRGGKADDLELIWGVGPGLEKMLNKMGFWHFDQIAAWSAKELKWVDENLKGFKGRASRDEWVPQAKKLAKGWRPENAIGDKPGKKK